MSDTPETDAEIEHPENVMCDWYRAERLGETEGPFPQVVPADFARRLERERDQAYEALHFANGTADLAIKHRDQAETAVEQIRSLVTSEHESKEAFIQRVQACLPSQP